jgi:hypothetical protein
MVVPATLQNLFKRELIGYLPRSLGQNPQKESHGIAETTLSSKSFLARLRALLTGTRFLDAS